MRVLLPALAGLAVGCTPFGAFMVRPLEVPVAPMPDTHDDADAASAERVWQSERPPAQRDPDVVRFVAVGDLGLREDSDRTMPHPYARRLADIAEAACDEHGGCDFAVWLGDNVGPAGVQGRQAEAFLTDLALHWRQVGPIYTVLGDKDWGPAFPSQRRADKQLAWVSDLEDRRHDRQPNALDVRGDAHFWSFRTSLVDVHGIDTNYLVRRCRVDGERVACNPGKLEEGEVPVMSDIAPMEAIGRDNGRRWTIVLGHHPYLSTGRHGDAGYLRDLGLPLWPGSALEKAMDDHVVGRADLYVSAHDLGLQFTDAASEGGRSRTGLVVAGSGADATGRRANATRIHEYEDPGEIGFTMVEATPQELTVRFYTLTSGVKEAAFTSCRGAGRANVWRYGDVACAPAPEVVEEPEMVVEAAEVD